MKASALLIALLFSLPAAADVDKRARGLAATCSACHGTDGKSVGGTAMLAAMDKAELVKQMQAFKSGQRKATVMHQHAKGYSDEEIEKMASYFAAQSRSQ